MLWSLDMGSRLKLAVGIHALDVLLCSVAWTTERGRLQASSARCDVIPDFAEENWFPGFAFLVVASACALCCKAVVLNSPTWFAFRLDTIALIQTREVCVVLPCSRVWAAI